MNVAKTIAAAFAKYGKDVGVGPCTLTKVTPGTRTPGNASGGNNPTTTVYRAQGLVTDFSTHTLEGTLIKVGDRKILIFGASLPAGVAPGPGDRVTFGSETYTIPDKAPVSADPVQAAFIFPGRK